MMSTQTINRAAQAYSTVDIDSQGGTDNPAQLVVLLYDGAISSLAVAKGEMLQRNFANKGKLIGKTIDIIEALRAALDVQSGGEIARNLADLYEYMKRQLSLANLRNSIEMLEEVQKLLSGLRDAWLQIAKPGQQQAATAVAQPDARQAISYGKA